MSNHNNFPPRKRARIENHEDDQASNDEDTSLHNVPPSDQSTFLSTNALDLSEASNSLLYFFTHHNQMNSVVPMGPQPLATSNSTANMLHLNGTTEMTIEREDSKTDDEEQGTNRLGTRKKRSRQDIQCCSSVECGEEGCNCNQPSSDYGELEVRHVLDILFQNAKEGNETAVNRMLRVVRNSSNRNELHQAIISAVDDSNLTLLMWSVRHNQLQICKYLLELGADVNQKTKREYALLIAGQKGFTDIARLILMHGANEESKNVSLIPAAHFGYLEVVDLLLNAGANQNYSNKKGTTPLMRAAQEGKEHVVAYLLDRNADPCAANHEGMTALMLAAQRGHAKIATRLIGAGSNVNKQTRQGSTALLLAAKRCNMEAVEALLAAGADIFLKDERDRTAADTAKGRNHMDVYVKITVANQMRLMRNNLRSERCDELMRLSSLYDQNKVTFSPSYQNPVSQQKRMYRDIIVKSFRLPRPLLQNIAMFIPNCPLWDRRASYLCHEIEYEPSREHDPSSIVVDGIHILDEILSSVVLEYVGTCKSFRRSVQPSTNVVDYEQGHLTLFRDNEQYRKHFMENSPPMSMSLVNQLVRIADIQGAVSYYATSGAISFGVQVAQDVLSLVNYVLQWRDSWAATDTVP